ncbi:MAG TPA: PilZ domain-containing protein [Thermoanaerobaculia bacterium]|nr:PilZ domain-containing protein [Thermoanaerobaculia bacterium]
MNSVLLVDDCGLFKDAGEAIKRRTSCRLLTASTGSEALALAREERPDVVFLDSELSGMSGVDVCRVLKADPRFSRTPIVLVTDEDGSEIRRAAADATLPRSFDGSAFFGTLRRFLQLLPRHNERSAVEWEVTFWRDGAEHAGTIRDLSRGGFFVRTPMPLPIGARIEVSFETPGERRERSVVAEAIVVRHGQDPERGLGCRFFRLTQGSRAQLEDCLRLLSLAEAPEPAERG